MIEEDKALFGIAAAVMDSVHHLHAVSLHGADGNIRKKPSFLIGIELQRSLYVRADGRIAIERKKS